MKCSSCHHRDAKVKGLCIACYYRMRYHNEPATKNRILQATKRWRKKHRLKYLQYIYEYKRKHKEQVNARRRLRMKMKKEIKIGHGKMIVRNHFLVDESSLNIKKGELKKHPQNVRIFYSKDSDPKKPIGKAWNFKYKDGVLYCDVEIPEPTKDSPALAVVPVFEGERTADGTLANVKLVHCVLTQDPLDPRCLLKY